MSRHAELHCHTEFSFLDGASSANDLVERAAQLGIASLAVTDHQGLYGAVRFVTTAEAAGIRPVVGVEIELLDAAVPDPHGIVVPSRRRGARAGAAQAGPGRVGPGRIESGRPVRPRAERLRLPGHRDPVREDLRGVGDGQRGPHLVLLARDQAGYRSLSRLVSAANLAGTKGVPRFTHDLLERHTEGVVALSGCRHGEIARRLLAGDREGAARAAEWYARLFGGPRGPAGRSGGVPRTGAFALELQHHLLPDDDWLVAETARLAAELGLPVVVTNDVHYALREDRELQDVVVAIRSGLTLDESAHLRRPNGEYHLKSAGELLALPPGDSTADPAIRRAWSDGMATAAELADACRVDLGFERYRFPGFEVPKGETPFSHLEALCHEGARRRYHPLTPRVLSQLVHELDVIERTGLAEFFLICWDLMRFARDRGIPAQGRGSAGDSIVAYVLGITRVDPIRHNLLFERFINEGRTSYPDVDIDFASSRREEVIQYVYERYGPEHTGMVCNVITYRARSAVREVGYALGFPRPLVDRVAKALETYDSVMVRRDLEADGGFAEFFAPPLPPPAGSDEAGGTAGSSEVPTQALTASTGFVDEMGQLNHARGGRWRQGRRGPSDDEGGPGDSPASVAWLRAEREHDPARMLEARARGPGARARGPGAQDRTPGTERRGVGTFASEREARGAPGTIGGRVTADPADACAPGTIGGRRIDPESGVLLPAERRIDGIVGRVPPLSGPISSRALPAALLHASGLASASSPAGKGQEEARGARPEAWGARPDAWRTGTARSLSTGGAESGVDDGEVRASGGLSGAATFPGIATEDIVGSMGALLASAAPDRPVPGRATGHPAPDRPAAPHSSVARLEPEPPPERHEGSTSGLSPWERWLELCARIDGRPRHLGIHVGGMLVTAAPLVEIAPLERATMPGRVVVQYDKRDVETMKLIKLDLLGLRMLSAMDDALRDITADCGVGLDLDRLPEDLPDVFRMIRAADTTGVFQIESRAQMQTLPRSAPATLDDLVVEVAIIRPGPIQGNAVHPYLRRRQGIEPVSYLHPSLEPVLRETLGVILYQEQVMEIAIRVAGFSAAESDGFRRAMGTWRSSREMEKLHRGFVDGCRTVSGLDEEQAEELFRQVAAFASFGFNKSHAAAFARTAYESAFLKLYYPAQFTAGLINNQPMGFYPVEVLVNDAKRHGVAVLPVDLNRSRYRTTTEWVGMPGEPLPEGCGIARRPPVVRSSGCVVPDSRTRRQLAAGSAEGYGVRLGLHLVKGIGEEHAGLLDGELERGQYRSLADVVARTGLAEEVVERLIRAGALDSLGRPRRELLWHLREVAASTGRTTTRTTGRALARSAVRVRAGGEAPGGPAGGSARLSAAPAGTTRPSPPSPVPPRGRGPLAEEVRYPLGGEGHAVPPPLSPAAAREGPANVAQLPPGEQYPEIAVPREHPATVPADPGSLLTLESCVTSGRMGGAGTPEPGSIVDTVPSMRDTQGFEASGPMTFSGCKIRRDQWLASRADVRPLPPAHADGAAAPHAGSVPAPYEDLPPATLDLRLPPTAAPELPPPTELERLADSYAILSLDARRQVVELFRPALERLGAVPNARLADLRPGRVRLAGLVVTRQHPMTARGTVFLALEDETGMVNVTLWPDRWARFRGVVRRHALLWIEGELQREASVVNVVATEVRALPEIARVAGGPPSPSGVRAQGYAGIRRG